MPGSVLLGFSGGIDSTAAARMLQSEGWTVTLLWLRTGDDPVAEGKVTAAAEALGLPLVVDDVRAEFRRSVIDYFVGGYVSGETPAPCTVCNAGIKWRSLYDRAEELGVDRIATGHYFRIREVGGVLYVARAADTAKDQSYYLWSLPQRYLRRVVTPMGGVFKKDVVRGWSGGRPPAESMSVCFLGGRSYGDLLREHGVVVTEGDVVDSSGTVIGRHRGYPLYTIGQKRGFDAPAGMCVTGIDAAGNRIVAGRDEDLYSRTLTVRDWYSPDPRSLVSCGRLSVVIRGYGRNPGGYAKAEERDGKLVVSLGEPAWAPAKGQPVVFYCDDMVMGGGFLENYF